MTTPLNLKWSKAFPPNGGKATEEDEKPSFYDHRYVKTPLGMISVEWKSWKENDSYCIDIDGEFIDIAYELDDVNRIIDDYLIKLQDGIDQIYSENR